MKIKTWQIISIGGLLVIGGVGLGYILDELLYSQILAVLGIEIVIIELIRNYIFKKRSLRILGIIILIFSILNFFRHKFFFEIISRFSELYDNSLEWNLLLLREFLWLILSVWILIQGINLLAKNDKIGFGEYSQSIKFKILIIGILILFALEVPVFGIHGDFGGSLHGHSFWDGGTHFH